MDNIVFLNGAFLPQAKASVSPLDRGFLFGDGVYEVIPVYAGRPFGLEKHLKRLDESLAAIQCPNPYTLAEWTEILTQMIAHQGHNKHLSLYCQVTRGAGQLRQLTIADNPTPTVFAMAQPFTPPSIDKLAQGMRVITVDDKRAEHTHIKSTALLASTLMRLEAQAKGAEEAIILNAAGQAIEGLSSNLFWVKDKQLATPPLSSRMVNGVTRELIIKLSEQHNNPCTPQPCTVSCLLAADEVWLTGSTKEIVPVLAIDGQTVGNGVPGPAWRQMISWYKAALHTTLVA